MQFVRTSSGVLIPAKERLTVAQFYDSIQNDKTLVEAGFGLAPVSVLLAGIQ